MSNDPSENIFVQPDKWDMVNVTGVRHEDVRLYLRKIFEGRAALATAKRKEMEDAHENKIYTFASAYAHTNITSMWYESSSNVLLNAVVQYRKMHGKKLLLFLMHRRPLYLGEAGIYQRRRQTGRNLGGGLDPFFLYVPSIPPNEKIPVARILQPLRRPIRLANPVHVLKTWWTSYQAWPYAADEQQLRNTLNLLRPHMPTVPYVEEGAYFKAIRHNGFLRNVIWQLQCLVQLYTSLSNAKHAIEWPEMRVRYRVYALPPRYKSALFDGNLAYNEQRQRKKDAMFEEMRRDVVIQTSDLLDAAADGIPDIYKHDHLEQE